MTNIHHVRISVLARELEVKAGVIIHVLPYFGVTERKDHSSSIPADVAEKIRAARALLGIPAAAPPIPSKHAARGLASAQPETAPTAIEDLRGVRQSTERELNEFTYEELLAEVKRLERELAAKAAFVGPRRGKRRRKRRKKRDKYRVVAGGLPSLGKNR